MRLSDIIRNLRGIFERKRKNPVQLDNDSNLESKLKPLKVSNKNTPLQISEDTVDVKGSLKVNGSDVQTGTDAGATELNELSDVTYSSGDLTISSLDKIIVSNDLEFQTGDGSQGLIKAKVSGQPQNFFEVGAEGGSYSSITLNETGGDTTADYFNINTAEHGATTISTVDAAGTDANLTLDVDGDIELNADGGDVTIKDGSSKYFAVSSQAMQVFFATNESNFKAEVTSNRGATTLSTTDAGGTNSGHLSIIPDGALKLEGEDSGVYIKEYANAGGDLAGYGQIWISGSTPNELAFTDDAGTDVVGIGKYHYESKITNYYATALGNFIPLAGYIIERTSTASQNEFIAMVAPYNGTIEKVMYRSEAAQNGTLEIDIHESSDGTEVPPATPIGTKDTSINIADDTTQEISFASMTSGSNAITKGRIYAIKITTPAATYDTNVTVVFKWDITS